LIVCKKTALSGIICFSLASLAFCQNSTGSVQAPVAPTVTAPAMPSVSAPSLSSNWHTPGSNGFYSGVKKNSTTSQTPAAPSTPVTPALNQTTASSLASSVTASQASSALNGLTASDLNGLNNMGLLSSFAGLFSGSSQNTNSSTDTVLLEQILNELNVVKQKVGEVSIQQASSQNAVKTSNPKILRFVVNGIDINSSCRQVFFSSQESDGSFLLTADRKYMAQNTARSETFYLLFRARGNSSGITNYSVTPEILQDQKNDESPVYKLCEQNGLTATRTGNMVKMTCYSPELKLDLLLSLD